MTYEFEFQYIPQDIEKPILDLTGVIVYRIHRESNYGADLDGNRGQVRHFLDIKSVMVYEGTRLLSEAEFDAYKQAMEIFINDHKEKVLEDA